MHFTHRRRLAIRLFHESRYGVPLHRIAASTNPPHNLSRPSRRISSAPMACSGLLPFVVGGIEYRIIRCVSSWDLEMGRFVLSWLVSDQQYQGEHLYSFRLGDSTNIRRRKVFFESVIRSQENSPDNRLTLPTIVRITVSCTNYRRLTCSPQLQLATSSLALIHRLINTVIRVTIRAPGMSDLLSDGVQGRLSSASISPAGGRFVMDGVETVVVRRLDSPFAERVEVTWGIFSGLSGAIQSRFLVSNAAASKETVVKHVFSSIPTAPIRRIDNVFIQPEHTSSFFSAFMDRISGLFTSAAHNDQSSDRCQKSDDSSDAGDSSDSDSDVDVLVSGIRGIALASPLRRCPSAAINYPLALGGTGQYQSHNEQIYADRYRTETPTSPWQMNQVDVNQSAIVAPHVDVNLDVEMYYVNDNISSQAQSAPRSAMKGARFRDSLFGSRFNPFNRVTINEHIQVHPVPYWIDRQRDIQGSTRYPVSGHEGVRLQNTVGWLEEERRAGLI